jgi:hypothetical protein
MTKDTFFPEIDFEDFELSMHPDELPIFNQRKEEFQKLIFKVIEELNLRGKIEKLSIDSTLDVRRAEIHREKGHPFPSKELRLCIYLDNYMDENLIRHEFMHEADRHNPEMEYDPDLEKKWQGYPTYERAILETVINISVDSRLEDRGLGKERRKTNFHELIGEGQEQLFEDLWENPPKTWPGFENTAKHLISIKNPNSFILEN